MWWHTQCHCIQDGLVPKIPSFVTFSFHAPLLDSKNTVLCPLSFYSPSPSLEQNRSSQMERQKPPPLSRTHRCHESEIQKVHGGVTVQSLLHYVCNLCRKTLGWGDSVAVSSSHALTCLALTPLKAWPFPHSMVGSKEATLFTWATGRSTSVTSQETSCLRRNVILMLYSIGHSVIGPPDLTAGEMDSTFWVWKDKVLKDTVAVFL